MNDARRAGGDMKSTRVLLLEVKDINAQAELTLSSTANVSESPGFEKFL